MSGAAAGEARAEMLEALAARLRAGESLRLLCWCHPKRCHAVSIADMLRRLTGLEEASARG